MNQSDNPLPDLLLDYHLGLLSEEQAEEVRQEIAADERSAAQSRNLSAWLGLLDAYETPPPPAQFVDRIVDRVAQTPPLRLTEVASSLPPSSGGGSARRPVLSLGELMALAACIILFVGVAVPGVSHQRSRQRQATCAAGLGSIFRGVSEYAAGFNGQMPQTAGFVPGGNWLQAPDPQVPRMANSRNRYMLVRLRMVRPKQFICAAMRNARPMDAGRIADFDDFPAPENCSFDSQNVAGRTLPLGAVPEMPIFADRNPLFDGSELDAAQPYQSNSRSHERGRGQNVLSANGRVLWTTSPVFNLDGDNIWQIEGVSNYTGTELPLRPKDAFIIP